MRILIADDHAIVRQGVRAVLTAAYPSANIEEVEDADSLLKKSITDAWDLVITDLTMPGRSGLEVMQQIKENHPELPVLVLSMHPEGQYATRVLKAGASGYVNKNAPSGDLIKAVNRVLQGRKYITPEVAEKLANDLDSQKNKLPHEKLSDREFEVMKLIASGKSVLVVADQLSLSSSTVSTYRARILEKMNLDNNAELTRYALDNGLI